MYKIIKSIYYIYFGIEQLFSATHKILKFCLFMNNLVFNADNQYFCRYDVWWVKFDKRATSNLEENYIIIRGNKDLT